MGYGLTKINDKFLPSENLKMKEERYWKKKEKKTTALLLNACNNHKALKICSVPLPLINLSVLDPIIICSTCQTPTVDCTQKYTHNQKSSTSGPQSHHIFHIPTSNCPTTRPSDAAPASSPQDWLHHSLQFRFGSHFQFHPLPPICTPLPFCRPQVPVLLPHSYLLLHPQRCQCPNNSCIFPAWVGVSCGIAERLDLEVSQRRLPRRSGAWVVLQVG